MREEYLLTISRDELKILIRDAILENKELFRFTEIKNEKTERFFSIFDLCKLLGVTRPTIDDWRKSGKLKFRRLGGRVYFLESEVLEALQKVDLSSRSSFLEGRTCKK